MNCIFGQIRRVSFVALLAGLFLFVLPLFSSSKVYAGTWTIEGIPICPAGQVPLHQVRFMHTFWPPPNSSGLTWLYTPYTNGYPKVTVSATSGGGYFAMQLSNGTIIPGESVAPYNSYLAQFINPTWSGWNPITRMIYFQASSFPSGTYQFYYRVPSESCAAPTPIPQVLSAPTITAASCDANGRISVSWAGTPNAAKYALRFHNTFVGWDDCRNTNGNGCAETTGQSLSFQGSPGKTYSFWMHGVSTTNQFGPSATRSITCTIPPPTNFNAACSGGNATFTWSAASGISQYYWRMTDLTSGQYYSNDSVAATSYTFNGAVPGRSYRAWIHSKRADIAVHPNWSDAVYKEFTCPALPKCTIQGPATSVAGNPTAYAVQGQGATATQMFFAPKGTQMWTQFSGNATFPKDGQYDVVCNAQGLGGGCTGNPSRAGQEDDCGATSRITVNVIAPSPTVTPTPAGFCTSNANCTGGNVCVNQGCVAPSPTPSPTQVPPTPTITPTNTPPATPTPNCYLRPKGDANCNNVIDSEDYTIWRAEFLGIIPQEQADFSGDTECKDDEGKQKFVCQYDLEILFRSLIDGYDQNPPTPTRGAPTATPTPATAS